MITKEELIYDIKSTISGGDLKIADDLGILNEHILHRIILTRAFLIRQNLNKGRFVSDNIEQKLECVPVQMVDSSSCPDLPSGCKLYRTVNEIPKFIEMKNDEIITRISPVDFMGVNFTVVPFARAVHSLGLSKKFTVRGFAFLRHGFIYISDYPRLLTKINIDGVFEDPDEVYDFNSGNGIPCSDLLRDFAISADMAKTLTEIVSDYFIKQHHIISDEKNNSKDDKPVIK